MYSSPTKPKKLWAAIALTTGGQAPLPITRYNSFKVEPAINKWKRSVLVQARGGGKSRIMFSLAMEQGRTLFGYQYSLEKGRLRQLNLDDTEN